MGVMAARDARTRPVADPTYRAATGATADRVDRERRIAPEETAVAAETAGPGKVMAATEDPAEPETDLVAEAGGEMAVRAARGSTQIQ